MAGCPVHQSQEAGKNKFYQSPDCGWDQTPVGTNTGKHQSRATELH